MSPGCESDWRLFPSGWTSSPIRHRLRRRRAPRALGLSGAEGRPSFRPLVRSYVVYLQEREAWARRYGAPITPKRKRRHRCAGSGGRRSALVVALEKPGAAKTADHAENDRQCDCLSHRVLLAKSRLGYKRIWMRRGWEGRRIGLPPNKPRARDWKKSDQPGGAWQGIGNRMGTFEGWGSVSFPLAPPGRP